MSTSRGHREHQNLPFASMVTSPGFPSTPVCNNSQLATVPTPLSPTNHHCPPPHHIQSKRDPDELEFRAKRAKPAMICSSAESAAAEAVPQLTKAPSDNSSLMMLGFLLSSVASKRCPSNGICNKNNTKNTTTVLGAGGTPTLGWVSGDTLMGSYHSKPYRPGIALRLRLLGLICVAFVSFLWRLLRIALTLERHLAWVISGEPYTESLILTLKGVMLSI